MGERLLCKQEVIGSNPFTSTTGGHHRGAIGVWRSVDDSAPGRVSGAGVLIEG